MRYARFGFLRSFAHLLTASALLFFAVTATAATVQLVNLDGPGEGFNDASPAVPNQTGNNGRTLGEQRLNVFRAAAAFWEARLVSSVPITVDINMDPLPCDAGGGVLGSAGPQQAFANFPNAPLPDVAYVVATANSLAGVDLDPSLSDIGTRFNVDIDNNDQCLNGVNWWLGINSPAPSGTISLFDTVLHEIGHGLGVSSLVALTPFPQFGIEAGDFLTGNIPPVYAVNLRDETLNLTWNNMTSTQRVASSTNTGNLVWAGNSANTNSDHLDELLSRTNGRIRMFAPNPVQGGSSVSHWDTVLTPDELMEPIATETSDERSTLQMLEDVGWQILDGPGEVSFVSTELTVFEDRQVATIELERSNGVFGAVSVTVSSSDITAVGGVDYAVTNAQVSWDDRETGIKTITVDIFNDDEEELGDETASFSLSEPTGGLGIGANNVLTLTIKDPEEDFLLQLIPAILSGSQRK